MANRRRILLRALLVGLCQLVLLSAAFRVIPRVMGDKWNIQIDRGSCADLAGLSVPYPYVSRDLAEMNAKPPFVWTRVCGADHFQTLYVKCRIDLESVRRWSNQPGVPLQYLEGGIDKEQGELGSKESLLFKKSSPSSCDYHIYVFPDGQAMVVARGDPRDW